MTFTNCGVIIQSFLLRLSNELGWESSKEKKYKGNPLKKIINFLIKIRGIDISKNKIKYLKDFPDDILKDIKRVYFLYDPLEDESCENLCKKEGLSPYDYFNSKSIPILISRIPDPFDAGEEGFEDIYERIYDLVSKIK